MNLQPLNTNLSGIELLTGHLYLLLPQNERPHWKFLDSHLGRSLQKILLDIQAEVSDKVGFDPF